MILADQLTDWKSAVSNQFIGALENFPEAKFFKIALRCFRNIEVVIPISTKLRIINSTENLIFAYSRLNAILRTNYARSLTWWLKYRINMIYRKIICWNKNKEVDQNWIRIKEQVLNPKVNISTFQKIFVVDWSCTRANNLYCNKWDRTAEFDS